MDWTKRILLLAVLALAAGCGSHWLAPFGPHRVSAPPNQLLENPLFVPIADRELVWNQLVDEIDDYFKIEREQRVQEVGGVLMEGRIDTYPAIASTLLEPWRRDSTPGFEKLHSTLQSTRRRATVRVIPRGGGYLVEVQVIKELEDVNRPEHATVGGSTLRHDGSLVRNEANVQGGPTTLGWITLGRDTSLEQQILVELRSRLSNIQPPGKHFR
jgi:hypothetical protein